MKKYISRQLLILLASALAFSCSSTESPERKVEEFYEFLNAGDYAKAKEFYSTEARRAVEQDIPNEEFIDWARNEETKRGTIENVKIINSIIKGESATVNYALIYKDGSTANRSAILSKEGNIWKLGLIPSEPKASLNAPQPSSSPSNITAPTPAQNYPSESDAIKELEALSQRHKNLFKVNSFHKTDGQAASSSGINQYKMWYQAEFECLRKRDEVVIFGKVIKPGFYPINCNQVGEVKRVVGAIEFEQTESGWHAVRLNGPNYEIREIQ